MAYVMCFKIKEIKNNSNFCPISNKSNFHVKKCTQYQYEGCQEG